MTRESASLNAKADRSLFPIASNRSEHFMPNVNRSPKLSHSKERLSSTVWISFNKVIKENGITRVHIIPTHNQIRGRYASRLFGLRLVVSRHPSVRQELLLDAVLKRLQFRATQMGARSAFQSPRSPRLRMSLRFRNRTIGSWPLPIRI